MFQLTEPSIELEKSYKDYINEWEAAGEEIVPTAAKRDRKSFVELIKEWEAQKTDQVYERGWVPASLYFLIDENKKIYGALQIRHELNQSLLNMGGHIGYGIRPSERRKGLATQMLSLSFERVKKLGIEKVLVTCDKNNIGSAKTIIKNGGVLENEVEGEDRITQRYWIKID